MDVGLNSPGMDDDSRVGVLLWWLPTKKERPVHDLLRRRNYFRRLVPSKCNYYSQIRQCMLNTAWQWFLWGFSLAFSDTASTFVGDLRQSSLDTFSAPLIRSLIHFMQAMSG